MLKKINLKTIPQGAGIYIFKDKENKPLYIGKAKNLRKRISQYFKTDSLKIKKLLEDAEKIEFVETENEVSAIFKESDLIKKLNPPYNQLLRDDTRYFYLIFTKEKLPKIFITHQPEKFKNQEIIGPFFEGSSLKKILNILRKEIPFCTCKEKHLRNCLNANLGLCYGWCCLKNAKLTQRQIKIYHQNLNFIKKIFTQDLKRLKKVFLRKIKNLLEKNEIEEAAKIKNVYLAIKKIEESQSLIKENESLFPEHQFKSVLEDLKNILNLESYPHLIEVIDISHFSGQEKVGVIVSFIDGIYQPHLLKKFKIKTILKPDDPRMISEVLKRRLKHKEWPFPDLILVDGGKIQLKFAQKAIEENNLDLKVIAFAKPKKELYWEVGKKIELEKYPHLKDFIVSLDKKTHQIVIKYHRRRRDELKN
jgi:excinuclease ABC subunit C